MSLFSPNQKMMVKLLDLWWAKSSVTNESVTPEIQMQAFIKAVCNPNRHGPTPANSNIQGKAEE